MRNVAMQQAAPEQAQEFTTTSGMRGIPQPDGSVEYRSYIGTGDNRQLNRIFRGTDKAYFEGEEPITAMQNVTRYNPLTKAMETTTEPVTTGMRQVYRNTQTGAPFGSLAEAERGNPAETMKTFAQGGLYGSQAGLADVQATELPLEGASMRRLRADQGKALSEKPETTKFNLNTGQTLLRPTTEEAFLKTNPDGSQSIVTQRDLLSPEQTNARVRSMTTKLNEKQKSAVRNAFADREDVDPWELMQYISANFGISAN
jgi:hypothetical protein